MALPSVLIVRVNRRLIGKSKSPSFSRFHTKWQQCNPQRRCQITLLSTIHLKTRYSGDWFGILFWWFEPRVKKELSEIKPLLIELTYRRVYIFRRFFGMFGSVAILCRILRNLWTLTCRWSLGTNSRIRSHWFSLFYDPKVTQRTHFCCVLFATKTGKITLKICQM